MTACLTPSSLKLGLYSSLNRFKMASSSSILPLEESRSLRTLLRFSVSSSILTFASPLNTPNFPPFPAPLTTLPRSCLSISTKLLVSASTLSSWPLICTCSVWILSSTSFFSRPASLMSSFRFLLAAPRLFCRASSCFFHSFPILAHRSSHLTPPTLSHSSLPSQQSS